jgi:hypothetical protein
MIELEDYINQLMLFDWFYEMTDDHSVWSSNNNKMTQFILKAKTDPRYKAAFNAVKEYMSDQFGTNAPQQLRIQLEKARNLT